MAMKIFSPIYLAALVLTVIYCKTNALQRKDYPPRRCYQCQGEDCEGRLPPAATCPPERPLCATVAGAPNYTSSLTCAAGGENPCSLIASSQLSLKMTCTCSSQLCNGPFTRNLQNELVTFSSTNIPKNLTDYIDLFWKQSHLVDDDETHVYKMITLEILDVTVLSFDNATEGLEMRFASSARLTRAGQAGERDADEVASAPRAEPLKQASTAPSDDDEDEGEGSGAEDEGRAPPSPSAPAAPSSYLPADDNSAHQPYIALLATIPPFFYLLL